MAETLKSLLRPLRNAILSSSTPEATPQQTTTERESERNLARTKGFTYLKSMEELLSWNEELEDPIQRSNILLLSRPSLHPDSGGGKARTTVIHDFGSAYHDYEANNRCIGIDEEKFCLTSSELSFTDCFIYFAHYLVSAPPPSWVNLCHQNGVKCLGMFIIEPQMPKEEVGKVFERDGEGRFVIARVLGAVARWVGFEGWLVNIEGVFAEEVWDVDLMVGFLEELRGYGTVVWYDALTTTNKISHQNALTPLNLPFALASSSLLTNYTWTPSLISSSLTLASKHSLPPQNLIFGIDIWAQNRPRSFLHPRLTWPLFDGGGTNTGFAVAKCVELGVSAGLFAPGWSWEHFGSTNDRREAEGAMWRGDELGESVRCDCKVGFWETGRLHRGGAYKEFGVVRGSVEFVVGGEEGFWTGFERAFGRHDGGLDGFFGGGKMHSQLGAQGIMPIVVEEGKKGVWWSVSDEMPGMLSIFAAASEDEAVSRQYLKLYNLRVRVEKDTTLMVRYQQPQPNDTISVLLIKIHGSSGASEELVPLPAKSTDDPQSQTLYHKLSPIQDKDTKITSLGVVITGILHKTQQILQITNLSIGSPSSFPSNEPNIRITNIKISTKGEGDWAHLRLTWQLEDLPVQKSKWWSERTGPIAYFDVGIDGIAIGRAYGLEYVLPDVVMERWKSEKGVLVELGGVLFGGARTGKEKIVLKNSASE